MKYELLDICNVELDTENPRIKQYLSMYKDDITSENIALALSASAGDAKSTYTTLKESIKVNGGIINPIVVNRDNNGRCIVIEGNTRLQIYKEFNKIEPEGGWGKIIALVHEDLPNESAHAIRLQSHLVGPRDWDPFSKAKYLNFLSEEEKMPINQIVSFCGGKKQEILKLIDAYSDMMNYHKPNVEDKGELLDPRDFSKFAELQNSKVEFSLVQNGFTKNHFSDWVLNKKVDKAQNVRQLPAILKNESAKKKFLTSNITEAVKVLNVDEKGKEIIAGISFNELIRELIKRCECIEHNYIRALRDDPDYQEDKDNLKELVDELSYIIEETEGI